MLCPHWCVIIAIIVQLIKSWAVDQTASVQLLTGTLGIFLITMALRMALDLTQPPVHLVLAAISPGMNKSGSMVKNM